MPAVSPRPDGAMEFFDQAPRLRFHRRDDLV
jgi:hypothetical protein